MAGFPKIAHYGADEKATSFFKSFFTGRSHYCKWNGERAELTPLYNYSYIQGSSAGAIIYNLYTRDLNNVTDDELVGFADDVNIVSSNDDPNQLIKETNKELKKVSSYMKENTLIINQQKSMHLIFKPKGAKRKEIEEKLVIDDEEVKRVDQTRYLGIWLDDSLKFDKQFETVIKRLEDTVRALIFVKDNLNYKAKLLIYNGLFKSISEYGAITYLDKMNKTQINTLIKLQKSAVRLIFSANATLTQKNFLN